MMNTDCSIEMDLCLPLKVWAKGCCAQERSLEECVSAAKGADLFRTPIQPDFEKYTID
ncbi:hypothetical protein HanPSC8_Chr17g0797821 [Helianthus annuus]|nr:hypothetical protein HanPSC8_Chr17g0797821 [Helianthus annuus]